MNKKLLKLLMDCANMRTLERDDNNGNDKYGEIKWSN